MNNGYLIPQLSKHTQCDGVLTNPSHMLEKNEESTYISVPAGGKSPYITLDFGRKTTGFVFIEMAQCSSDSLLLEYGPLEKCIHVRKIIKMPSSGVFWVDNQYIACRYLRISLISDSRQPSTAYAVIKRFGLVFSAYPCIWKGSFSCNDPVLDKIWEVGAYTVQLCMQKNCFSSENNADVLPQNNKDFIRNWKGRYSPYVIFDGPRRDREAWLGDIRTEALSIYHAFGADEVVKSSLELFLDLQRNDGTTVGCGGTWQEFKEYNLWWVIAVWECYLFTEDTAFLKQMYPGLRKLLDWIIYRMDDRGFLYNDGNWMWTLPREGYSSATQCILYQTLKCAALIEQVMFNEELSNYFLATAEKIKENINIEYWNEEKGVYVDNLKLINTEIPVMSDVNCYVVVFGIADENRADRVLNYLKQNMWTPYGSATLDKKIEKAYLSHEVRSYGLANIARMSHEPEKAIVELMYPHNRQIWPFINAYEVEANFMAGKVDEAFDLINRCWKGMAFGETGTFWEMVEAEDGEFTLKSFFKDSKFDCLNSAAHGWSGWITYIMQAYILGVKPLEPGYKKAVISPILGQLENVQGKVPTSQGIIEVHIVSRKDTLEINVIHPEAILIEVSVKPEVLNGRKLIENLQVKG